METNDKKNNPVADENVNIENNTVVNENAPVVEEVKEATKKSSFVDNAVKAAKKINEVVNDVKGQNDSDSSLAGGAIKIAGKMAGNAIKTSSLFSKVVSMLVPNMQAILISLAVAAVGGIATLFVMGLLADPKIEDTTNVVEEVKKISELTTACFYEESVIHKEKTTTKKHWIGNKIDTVKHTIVLTALCKVRAGYDLSKLGENDLIIKGDTISIKLPAPQIFDVISNPSDYKTFESTGDWSHEEVVAMQVEKKERVLQNALDCNILEKANNIGKGRVLTLFQGLGFNVINITVTEVPARVAPKIEATPVAEEVAVPAVEEVADEVTTPAVEEVAAPATEEQVAA